MQVCRCVRVQMDANERLNVVVVVASFNVSCGWKVIESFTLARNYPKLSSCEGA